MPTFHRPTLLTGLIPGLSALVVGALCWLNQPIYSLATAQEFWRILIAVWLGLGAALVVATLFTAYTRVGTSVILILGLLLGGAAALTTGKLANTHSLTQPMVASYGWLALFLICSGVEMYRRSTLNRT